MDTLLRPSPYVQNLSCFPYPCTGTLQNIYIVIQYDIKLVYRFLLKHLLNLLKEKAQFIEKATHTNVDFLTRSKNK